MTSAALPNGVTTSYLYDNANRLTQLTHTTGGGSATLGDYQFAVDAVGNRTVQTQTITSTVVTNYGYDLANRLTNVNGQSYTWDDNGNLLNDGAQTYGYDQSNRLKRVVQGAITTTFAYNGAGDRLQQTVNGSPTRYVLDPAAGLTQVLSDGTNTYLYGNARLARYQAAMQYFGADGLGSLRQIFDASAQVVGSSRYDPFGNVMSQGGTATSVFAFAGEQWDATGLEYLRARYYSSAQGRFTTRDPWEGNIALPGTLDHWVYVRDNPVNFLDPSGRIEQGEATAADQTVDRLFATYLVTIRVDWGWRVNPSEYLMPGADPCYWARGMWNLTDLGWVEDALNRITGTQGMRSRSNFINAMHGQLTIVRSDASSAAYSPPNLQWGLGDIVLTNGVFGGTDPYKTYSVIHEVGHVWDFRRYGELSLGLMQALGTITCSGVGGCGNWDPYANPEVPAGAQPGCTVEEIKRGVRTCGGKNVPYAFTYGFGPIIEGPGWEDWADSFADHIYPAYQQSAGRTNLETGGIRENYVLDQLNNVH